MAALIRAYDWAATPLGPTAAWPQSLKSAVDLILGCEFPMCVLWGPELVQIFNQGYRRHIAGGRSAGLGQPARNSEPELWPIHRRVLGGETLSFPDRRSRIPAEGEPDNIPVTRCCSPLRDEAGNVSGVLITTVAQSRTLDAHAEAILVASEQWHRQILDSATDYAIIATDIHGKVTRWSTGAERLLGWSESEMLGQPVARIFTPEDRAHRRAEREMQQARDGGHGTDERWHLRKQGKRFWASGEMMPLRDDAETVIGFVKVLRDRTEHRRSEQHRKLLVHELSHRVKNTLATVQSLAIQTFRGAGADAAMDRFESRLVALADTHDLLTREQWQSADVREIVQNAVAAWSGGDASRFRVEGPALPVRPAAALALAMALHELLTNAAKYGALSNATGTIGIDWSISTDAPAQFLLQWQERGGPPVHAPARRGFGSRLIEYGLATDLGGKVELFFDEAGVRCTLKAPLNGLAA